MTMIGYARVSTHDQDTAPQELALRQAGAVRIYAEKRSGGDVRLPELEKALSDAQAGDTLMVTAIDRLGRHMGQLVMLLDGLGQRGVHFRSLSQGIDTSTPAGELMFHLLAALAQNERRIISERTKLGIEAARARGRHPGRPTVMTPERIELAQRLRNEGHGATKVGEILGVGRSTVLRFTHTPHAAADAEISDEMTSPRLA